MRQNIRTAYNRVAKVNKDITLSFFSTCGIGDELNTPAGLHNINECREVYRMHQMRRYPQPLKKGLRYKLVIKYLNYTSDSIPGRNSFLAVLRISGAIAGFMEGYVNMSYKSLEIPRLAIKDNFAFYSPGMLLVCETAKWLMGNTLLRTIDLCRGTEKYKFDCGGKPYSTIEAWLNTGTRMSESHLPFDADTGAGR